MAGRLTAPYRIRTCLIRAVSFFGYLSLQEVLDSHPLEVHRTDAVIIRGIAACGAFECVCLMVPAFPVHMAAYGAYLAGVGRVNQKHGASEPRGLVGELLLEVVISPAYLCVTVLHPYAFCGAPDARKVFQHKERTLGVIADECLRDTMVHIVHPTVFSLPDGTDPVSCGRCLTDLELAAQLLVMGAFLLDLCAGMEGGLPAVVCGHKEAYAAVDADHPDVTGRFRNVRDLNGHRYVQEELAMLKDKLCGAELRAVRERPVHGLGMEGALDTSLQRVDAEEPFGLIGVPYKGVVPVPYKAELRGTERRFDVSMALLFAESFGVTLLVCTDRLVCRDHSAGDAGRHL